MGHSDREARDAAGVGPYAREREKLVALSSLDSWTVSEGEPDIRGWEVRTVNNRQLGTVNDLLIDAEAGEAVLLDVDLPGGDRHTFVPIRVVQIDRARRIVLMDSADLPVDDLARTAAGHVDRRATDVAPRAVRYPRADREVVVERPRIADAPPRDEPLIDDRRTEAAIEDRRRAERRRIQRVSTDL